MRRTNVVRAGGVGIVSLLLLAAGACATTDQSRVVTRSEPPASAAVEPAPTPPPAAEPAAPVAEAAPAPAQPTADEAEKSAADEAQKRAKLERELEVARLRLRQAELGREHGRIQAEQAVAAAEFELQMAQRRLETLRTREIPVRVARAEQGLVGAQDRVTEEQQELEQLELMYQDEQIADKAREIVLERAARRLERSRTNLDLQQRELVTLKERTIPVELAEAEQGVLQKEQALQRARREAETGRIDRDISIINAQAEVLRLEQELAALAPAESR